jgi:hypothetical protein
MFVTIPFYKEKYWLFSSIQDKLSTTLKTSWCYDASEKNTAPVQSMCLYKMCVYIKRKSHGCYIHILYLLHTACHMYI